MRIAGSVVQANASARIGNAAKPTISSGRRPHVFAWRPVHGAMIATMTWGTMINAETMSEENASLLYANASPASGSIDALAIWNKNTQPANTSRPGVFQRFPSRALGGALGPWWSGMHEARPKWISEGWMRPRARSKGSTSAAATTNIARYDRK